MKKEIFPIYALTCGIGHRYISTLPGLHKVVASLQGQEFILLTNPRHTLSCTILLACLTSKALFFKQSFSVPIHLFRGLPTERLTTHSLSNPFVLHSLHIAETSENTFINLFVLTTALSVHSGLYPFS